MTTTGTNDLIVASTIGLSGTGMIWENTMTGVTPGGSFFFDAADTQCSDADEEYVQPSPGSVTPSFTVTSCVSQLMSKSCVGSISAMFKSS